MLGFIRFIVIFLLFTLSWHGNANKITVAYGDALAPWVMPATQSGILVDLISQALTPLDYEIKHVYYPYARRIKAYQNKHIDAVCDINAINISLSNLPGYFSGEIYHYENYFYALEKHQFQFNHISDFTDHSVMSWQGAKFALGADYETMATINPRYNETHNQKLQVKLLYSGRVEVIQLDKNIFEYYRGVITQEQEFDTNQAIKSFSLLGSNPNGFLFHDGKIRDDFVKRIAEMKENGQFQKIFQKYRLTAP